MPKKKATKIKDSNVYLEKLVEYYKEKQEKKCPDCKQNTLEITETEEYIHLKCTSDQECIDKQLFFPKYTSYSSAEDRNAIVNQNVVISDKLKLSRPELTEDDENFGLVKKKWEKENGIVNKGTDIIESIELYFNSSNEKNIEYYKSRMDIEKKIVLLLTEQPKDMIITGLKDYPKEI
jgi:hypothetical protein